MMSLTGQVKRRKILLRYVSMMFLALRILNLGGDARFKRSS